MLYRDPANGKTVSQIPTESALKQYKEAQQKEKDADRASMLKLTVGGSGQAGGQSAAYGRGADGSGLSNAGSAGGTGRWTAAASGSAVGTATAAATTASPGMASVAHSSQIAAPSAARVDVVI
ncbi:hypothetical protein E6C72_12890 [Azospirillum sp. TSH100]|nr:hypothetical protein E6C72_12890 [Azospirillum sp. TSH100]